MVNFSVVGVRWEPCNLLAHVGPPRPGCTAAKAADSTTFARAWSLLSACCVQTQFPVFQFVTTASCPYWTPLRSARHWFLYTPSVLGEMFSNRTDVLLHLSGQGSNPGCIQSMMQVGPQTSRVLSKLLFSCDFYGRT